MLISRLDGMLSYAFGRRLIFKNRPYDTRTEFSLIYDQDCQANSGINKGW